MPIVPIVVNGKSVLGLMDSGATNTVISQNLAKELRLSGQSHRYVLNTVSRSDVKSSLCVNVNVSSVDGTFSEQLKNVLVCSPLPARYPQSVIDISQYPHLSDIQIPQVGPGDRVDMIIGMDNGHLLFPLESRRNPEAPREPFAVRYVFGWCLNGIIGDSLSPEVQSCFLQVEPSVDNLWLSDKRDLDDDFTYSVEDRRVVDLWDREIYRDEHGHYVLPIPWRDGRPNLPNNKFVAENRLTSLTKRLARHDMTEVYDENISKLIDSGYAEPVPDGVVSLRDGSVLYLPHHSVVNPAKPGKVRPVFDCAARCRGISVNSQCYQGPDIVNKLISVLMRFREYRFAIIADIEAMYLQVRVPENDRNALRFLWNDGRRVVEYRMTSHLFGVVWCAASSTYALRRTATDTQPSALVSATIFRSFYVDDVLRSCKSVADATEVIHGTKDVLNHGEFKLTKFAANDREILKLIDDDDLAKEVKELAPNTVSKALGIKWDVFQDSFYYVSKGISDDGEVTRRKILSYVSSLYDPLGLVCPVVICGKLIFQKVTRLQLSWDSVVPSHLSDRWLSWVSTLSDLDSLRFDRCVLQAGFEDAAVELHHFGDASSTAYGVCCYLRAINLEGRIHVALLAAKGRVAPLKRTTVPRLELMAAVLAVKMDIMLRRDLDISIVRSYFWTDSQIVLAYLNNVSRRFKVFVANRVAFIRDHSNPDQRRHVPGDENPADVISRGCLVKDLSVSWSRGPDILWQYKSDWRCNGDQQSSQLLDNDLEVIKDKGPRGGVTVMASEGSHQFIHHISSLIEHYGRLYRMKKALSWWRRYLIYLKDKRSVEGPLTCPELVSAEKLILRHVQNEVYHDDLIALKSVGHVKKSSSLRKLSPSLHDG